MGLANGALKTVISFGFRYERIRTHVSHGREPMRSIPDMKNCATPLILRETQKTKAGKRADAVVARMRDRVRDVRILPVRCTVGHRANSK